MNQNNNQAASHCDWDDPRITAFAIGQLGDDEAAAFKAEIDRDPSLASAVARAREVASQLEQHFAAEEIPASALRGRPPTSMNPTSTHTASTHTASTHPTSTLASSTRSKRQIRWPWVVIAASLIFVLFGLILPNRNNESQVAINSSQNTQTESETQTQTETSPNPEPVIDKDLEMTADLATASDSAIDQAFEPEAVASVSPAVVASADSSSFGSASSRTVTKELPVNRLPQASAMAAGVRPRVEKSARQSFAPNRFEDSFGGAELGAERSALNVAIRADDLAIARVRSALLAGETISPQDITIDRWVNQFDYQWDSVASDTVAESMIGRVVVTDCPWSANDRLVCIFARWRPTTNDPVELTVDFDPATVSAYRLINSSEPMTGFRRKDDSNRGGQLVAIFQCVFQPSGAASAVPMTSVTLSQRPIGGEMLETHLPIANRATPLQNADRATRLAVAAAGAAMHARGDAIAAQWPVENIQSLAEDAVDDPTSRSLMSAMIHQIGSRPR